MHPIWLETFTTAKLKIFQIYIMISALKSYMGFCEGYFLISKYKGKFLGIFLLLTTSFVEPWSDSRISILWDLYSAVQDVTNFCECFMFPWNNCIFCNSWAQHSIFVAVQSLSFVLLFATPWAVAHQASPSFTLSLIIY